MVRLDRVLAARGMTLVELSEQEGVSVVNLSVLKKRSRPDHQVLHPHRRLRRSVLRAR